MSVLTLKALKFAMAKHEGQFRKGSNEPYIVHPIEVSYVLSQFKQTKKLDELVCACLLHDTVEDTDTTFLEIAQEFPPMVASIVFELTSDEDAIKKYGKFEYMKKRLVGMSSYALSCKLADRLVNIRDLPKRKTVEDTIKLMEYLKSVRKLSKSQKALVDEILLVCNNILSEDN